MIGDAQQKGRFVWNQRGAHRIYMLELASLSIKLFIYF